MNGKQARNLRKLVKDNAPQFPAKTYTKTNKAEKLYIKGTKTDGMPEYGSYESYTLVLGDCQRALYQRAKKLHGMYYGR